MMIRIVFLKLLYDFIFANMVITIHEMRFRFTKQLFFVQYLKFSNPI